VATCMVPGCTETARNQLGIRLRKPSTRAVYAPNLDAYLCKGHAEAGGTYEINFDPGTVQTVDASVFCGGQQVTNRVTPIKKRAV
jgi:hypothetical protein